MRTHFLASAGAEMTVGRLAMSLPKKESAQVATSVSLLMAQGGIGPIEAEVAVRRCGLDLIGGYRVDNQVMSLRPRPFPLVPAEGETGVSINAQSSNGFPVGGKWSQEETRPPILGMAQTILRDLRDRSGRPRNRDERRMRIGNWVAEEMRARPSWWLFLGKCKADHYSEAKLEYARMRFYNVVPRQLLLVLQTATQPFEKAALNLTCNNWDWADSNDVRTAQGVSLARGGADKLVASLDALAERSPAMVGYTHLGDDSFVGLTTAFGTALFALDCTNFDLTQNAGVLWAVHEAISTQLAVVDADVAELWLSLIRGRLTLVSGTQVRFMRHGGPSGFPLQSKVNDVLMEVLLARVEKALVEFVVEHAGPWQQSWEVRERIVRDVVRTEGERLGLTVRLESFQVVEGAHSIRDHLALRPFKFAGYYFWADPQKMGRPVYVFSDLPRVLTQMQYPNLKRVEDRREFALLEAVRVGSIALGLGVPHPAYSEVCADVRRRAAALVDAQVRLFGPDKTLSEDDYTWAQADNPLGPRPEASLGGLRRAMDRWETIWKAEEIHLYEAARQMLSREYQDRSLDWADQVEEDERELRGSSALVRIDKIIAAPRAGAQPKPVRKPPSVAATHPATLANDGRPPPTVLWGPDKQPLTQERTVALMGLKSRRALRRARGQGYTRLADEMAQVLSHGDLVWSSEDEETGERFRRAR